MQKTIVDLATGAVVVLDMAPDEIAQIMAQGQPQLPAPLTREAFCVALIGAGILTELEATEAALGAWPSKFEPALLDKSLVDKLTIKNLWRETRTVARDAPLFLDLLAFYGAAKSLSNTQIEALGNKIFAMALA